VNSLFLKRRTGGAGEVLYVMGSYFLLWKSSSCHMMILKMIGYQMTYFHISGLKYFVLCEKETEEENWC
jgi:hypothetical protein